MQLSQTKLYLEKWTLVSVRNKKAILVLNAEKKKLGYIPEKDNNVFSRLMDAGKMLKAKIAEIKPGEWYTKINISIFLVDL